MKLNVATQTPVPLSGQLITRICAQKRASERRQLISLSMTIDCSNVLKNAIYFKDNTLCLTENKNECNILGKQHCHWQLIRACTRQVDE